MSRRIPFCSDRYIEKWTHEYGVSGRSLLKWEKRFKKAKKDWMLEDNKETHMVLIEAYAALYQARKRYAKAKAKYEVTMPTNTLEDFKAEKKNKVKMFQYNPLKDRILFDMFTISKKCCHILA